MTFLADLLINSNLKFVSPPDPGWIFWEHDSPMARYLSTWDAIEVRTLDGDLCTTWRYFRVTLIPLAPAAERSAPD